VLNKAQANLAMARRDLRVIEQEFFMGNPTAGPSGRGDNQAFFPSTPVTADRPRVARSGLRGASWDATATW
jgi:hypothetical protein